MNTTVIKPRSIKIDGGNLFLKTVFRKWEVVPNRVKKITLQPTISLIDEIGTTIEAEETFFLTDALEGFNDLAQFLNFTELFGEDWYVRADKGEVLEWSAQG